MSADTKVWMCMSCGYIYREADGDPLNGIVPGTTWDNVPDDWRCPDCGTLKSDFEMVEM